MKGLGNIGNTCSINTLIQCIGHCPTFLNFILKSTVVGNKLKDRKYSIYQELKEVFTHLWINNDSIIPRRFIKAFYESIGTMYAVGEQLDFTEMWMLLLNNIIDETHDLEHVSSNQVIVQYKDSLLYHVQKEVIESWNKFFKTSNSPLNDILYGIQIQEITCNSCNKIYHNIEPVAFHYIEITHGTSMLNGLEMLLLEEEMNGWKCDKCSNKNATKMVRFWKLPKVWMVVLQRFDNTSKIRNSIDIIEKLRINNNIEISSATPVEYQLYAIANHYGNLNGGHYTATCKNKNEWYEYDDMQITKIANIQNILLQNRNAYALFYERL